MDTTGRCSSAGCPLGLVGSGTGTHLGFCCGRFEVLPFGQYFDVQGL